MKAQILPFPTPLKLEKLTDKLWIIKVVDTPEARAQADRLAEELRKNDYSLTDKMKGE